MAKFTQTPGLLRKGVLALWIGHVLRPLTIYTLFVTLFIYLSTFDVLYTLVYMLIAYMFLCGLSFGITLWRNKKVAEAAGTNEVEVIIDEQKLTLIRGNVRSEVTRAYIKRIKHILGFVTLRLVGGGALALPMDKLSETELNNLKQLAGK